ncbi:MAG: SIR2 family NAD-dependent protein deacylase [Prevotella sp.]
MEKKNKLVFLTGAGMSVESGFKTFRGSDGMWENYPVEQVASHEGWEADPVLVNGFYNGLRKKLVDAQPNEGHRLVAEMEKWYDVTVVTQNVDDLHERAGSTKVIHLHGELLKVCSSRNVDDIRYIRKLEPGNLEVEPGERAGDGSLLRPYIVFFGEGVPNISIAAEEASKADIFVIIGTSLNVYPAAGLVRYASSHTRLFLIDPEEDLGRNMRGVTHISKGASEGMRTLMELLGHGNGGQTPTR